MKSWRQRLAERRYYLRNAGKVKDAARARTAILKRQCRQIAVAVKARPCLDCGGTFPPVCMDFDHVRGEKRDDVASFQHRPSSITALKAEMAKCELVCANCHRLRTERRRLASAGLPQPPKRQRSLFASDEARS